MVSPTHWMWVWANSRRWWRIGTPGVLQSMGLKRVGHDWATEQQWANQTWRVNIVALTVEVKVCFKAQLGSETGASLVAQMVKNLPIIQETQVWSLGQEDFLEKGMATHSSILAWRIPWTEEPGGLQYLICKLNFIVGMYRGKKKTT